MFAATATYPYQVVRSRLQVRTGEKLFIFITMVQRFDTFTISDHRASREYMYYDAINLKQFCKKARMDPLFKKT